MRYARVLVLAGVTALIMSCVGAALSNAGSDTVTYVFTTVIPTKLAAVYHGQIKVRVVNDVVRVKVSIPSSITIRRGGKTTFTMRIQQVEGVLTLHGGSGRAASANAVR